MLDASVSWGYLRYSSSATKAGISLISVNAAQI